MSSINDTGARAVADLAEGQLLASVEIAAAPERVFRALASKEITEWWVRPGVFDTREWTGDVHVGGRWRAAGMTRGQPYVQEGEFLIQLLMLHDNTIARMTSFVTPALASVFGLPAVLCDEEGC
jgi:hypothetical protein